MTETYYVTTWNDEQSLYDPKFKARNERRYGPFSSYEEAVAYPAMARLNFTHLKVERVYVAAHIEVRFVKSPNGK